MLVASVVKTTCMENQQVLSNHSCDFALLLITSAIINISGVKRNKRTFQRADFSRGSGCCPVDFSY